MERDGFRLWQIRLAKGAFEFAKVIGAAAGVEISATDLALILGGVALNARQRMRYSRAAAPAEVAATARRASLTATCQPGKLNPWTWLEVAAALRGAMGIGESVSSTRDL